MRILHIHKYFRRGGGADNYVLEVMRRQREAGHQTAIFATDGPDSLDLPGVERCLIGGRRLEDIRSPWRALAAAPGSLYSPRVARSLDRFLADWPPDVVHLHNYHYHLTPSILRALIRRRLPAVQTLHDYHWVCPNHHLYNTRTNAACEACSGGRFWSPVRERCRGGSLPRSLIAAAELALYRRGGLYRSAAQVFLSPSRFLIDQFRAMGFAHPRMEHLPNFVDAEAFGPGEKADPPYVVHFAGLAPHKGIGTLLRAMRLVPESRLKIAGAGPHEPAARALAAQLELRNVEFLGRLDGDALCEAVARAAFSIQSAEWPENGPLSVLESFACGTPVLAARIGGLPEMIEAGGTGELFESGDAEGLAAGIRKLLAAPEALRAMSVKARIAAESRYSAAGHMRKMEGYYGEAAGAFRGSVVRG